MQYITCDICNCPIKEEDYFVLSIIGNHDRNKVRDIEEYSQFYNKLTREIKDICPQCKLLFDEIFKLRKNNLHLISQELLGIWELKLKEKQ